MLGVILLIGNVTATAFWKVMADCAADPVLIKHAQRNVIAADWLFTLVGIILIIVGGYGMVLVSGMDPFGTNWLVWGQLLFLASGLIWVGILVPLQIRQNRVEKTLDAGLALPEQYRRDARTWLIWGIVATVPLVAATYVMIAQP